MCSYSPSPLPHVGLQGFGGLPRPWVRRPQLHHRPRLAPLPAPSTSRDCQGAQRRCARFRNQDWLQCKANQWARPGQWGQDGPGVCPQPVSFDLSLRARKWCGVTGPRDCLYCAGMWLPPLPPADVSRDTSPGSIRPVRAEVTG